MVAPVVQPRAQPHMHAAAVALIRVVAVAAGGEAELALESSPRKGGRGKAMRGQGHRHGRDGYSSRVVEARW